MSAPEIPSDPDPRAQAAADQNHGAASAAQPAGVSPSTQPPTSDGPAPPTPRKRPWGWIAITGLLAACVVGLGIYAVNLNSDLDDANAELAAQQEQIAAQQEQIDQAEETSAASVAAAQAAYDELTAQLGAAQQDGSQAVEQAAEELEPSRAGGSGRPGDRRGAPDAGRRGGSEGRECGNLRAIVPVGVQWRLQRRDAEGRGRGDAGGATGAPAAMRDGARRGRLGLVTAGPGRASRVVDDLNGLEPARR